MNPLVPLLFNTIITFVNIYTALLFIRILLSWFPNIDWSSLPFSILSQLTDPYLNLFRSIIPPPRWTRFFAYFGAIAVAGGAVGSAFRSPNASIHVHGLQRIAAG